MVRDGAFAPPHHEVLDAVGSERIQEIHEIGLLLLRKSDAKSLVVKIHRIQQGRSRTVVEIRCARGEPAQNGPLDFADISALPGDQGTSRIGNPKNLPGERPLPAGQGEHRQTGNVENRRALRPRVGDPDVERRLEGMVADIGRIVTGATESGKARDAKRIVEARNACNVDVGRIEQLFATGDRQSTLDVVFVVSVRAQ